MAGDEPALAQEPAPDKFDAMNSPPASPALQYAPRPARWRRGWVRRVILLFVLAGLVIWLHRPGEAVVASRYHAFRAHRAFERCARVGSLPDRSAILPADLAALDAEIRAAHDAAATLPAFLRFGGAAAACAPAATYRYVGARTSRGGGRFLVAVYQRGGWFTTVRTWQ